VLQLEIQFSDEAKAFLIDRGFDPALGARPLRRAIQRYLEDPISELLLSQGLSPETEIKVGVGGPDELGFDVVKAPEDAPKG
jgi:ATP-dependent Clp protease ATP-binding subunit ClpA